jgi:hypothetical protein
MKTATVLLVLSGLLLGQLAHAEDPASPRWVIVATIIDRASGQPLQQSVLEDPELQFENAARCNSILDRIHLVEPEGVAIALTCRQQSVPPKEII